MCFYWSCRRPHGVRASIPTPPRAAIKTSNKMNKFRERARIQLHLPLSYECGGDFDTARKTPRGSARTQFPHSLKPISCAGSDSFRRCPDLFRRWWVSASAQMWLFTNLVVARAHKIRFILQNCICWHGDKRNSHSQADFAQLSLHEIRNGVRDLLNTHLQIQPFTL